MERSSPYLSPLGPLVMTAGEAGLTGLWFQGQRFFPHTLPPPGEELPALAAARRWLDRYFAGKDPGPLPPLAPEGTPFRRLIWDLLLEIPRGETVPYGQLARAAAHRLGRPSLSAQAVGGAVGHNPISILIPCHRVVGRGGALTGYAAGLERKAALLALEGATLPPSPEAVSFSSKLVL